VSIGSQKKLQPILGNGLRPGSIASTSKPGKRNQPLQTKEASKEKHEKKELIWGYGSGVASATCPDYGDVVIAEYTQPFNEADVTYFRPLFARVIDALTPPPTHLAADAAFDAWYFYEEAMGLGGIGAVPLNQHSKTPFAREADETPRCPKGLLMQPTKSFNHTNGYRAQRFQCPLLFPEKTGKRVITNNSSKEKAASKMSIGNVVVFNALPLIAKVRSTRRFIPSAGAANASIVRLKRLGLNVPKCAIAAP
jgi:hypothetical protein